MLLLADDLADRGRREGLRYTASAVIGSVMIVAGFELTSTTR